MLGNDASADSLVQVIIPASCADTAAATSGWIDCRTYKGTIAVFVTSGAITGSFVGKLQGADDGSGTNSADITGATHSAISTANQVARILIPATARPYIKYVGTVTTGPVVLGVLLMARPGGAG